MENVVSKVGVTAGAAEAAGSQELASLSMELRTLVAFFRFEAGKVERGLVPAEEAPARKKERQISRKFAPAPGDD